MHIQLQVTIVDGTDFDRDLNLFVVETGLPVSRHTYQHGTPNGSNGDCYEFDDNFAR